MSDQNRNTVTRRRALKSGGIVALAAGLLGSGTVTAEPAPASDLVVTLCAEPTPEADAWFREWLTEWRAERARVMAQYDEVMEKLKAYVPTERRFELVGKLSDISGDLACLSAAVEREIAFRHLPGLTPMLRLLWTHASEMDLDSLDACGDGYCNTTSGPY